MTSDIVTVAPRSVPAAAVIFDLSPIDKIKEASAIARTLTDIVKQQKLSSDIKGKEYVRIEGWQTLGFLLGILPKEAKIIELPDGGYIACVELIDQRTGIVVGGASSLCGMDENKWKDANAYARRSMAVTRATGKAYRISFGWIVQLAGYQPTPYEEMPENGFDKGDPDKKESNKNEEKNDMKKTSDEVKYNPENRRMQDHLIKLLMEKEITPDLWDEISIAMKGRPAKDIDKAIEEVKSIFSKEQKIS